MEQQTFDLLVKHIDGTKTDLKDDIALLRADLKEVKAEVTANTRFKWKVSGVALVFTIMFQGVLAWIQRGSGHQ